MGNTNNRTSDRFLRLPQIIGSTKKSKGGKTEVITEGLIPISRTSWYDGISKGIYPPPTKLSGGRTSVWRESDVMAVVAGTYQRGGDSA